MPKSSFLIVFIFTNEGFWGKLKSSNDSPKGREAFNYPEKIQNGGG